MLFATYTYAVFLLAVMALYTWLPKRGRQLMLLVASYVFYCWDTPVYGILIFISTVLDYSVGLALDRTKNNKGRHVLLLCSLVGNLGLLGFFKYGDFIGSNLVGIGHLLGFEGHWAPMGYILPVGISFYTFQTLSYSIDVYRRQMKPERDFGVFALYVCYFPQLVAGPIERAHHLLPQLHADYHFQLDDFVAGMKRILTGLFLKLVVADRVGIYVDSVFANPGQHASFALWLSLLGFAVQIYLDFSSYASIAIGSARLFGVRLCENFNHPLAAVSIADFWNRWHMTLTRWFHDYLFVPLGGFRKGGLRAAANATIVLALCGLWHGADWNFVFWGTWNAILLLTYYAWKFYRKSQGHRKRPLRKGQLTPWVAVSVAATLGLNMVGLIFFRSPDMETIGQVFRGCFGLHTGPVIPMNWTLVAYGLLIGISLSFEWAHEYGRLQEKWERIPWPVRAAGWGLLVALTFLCAVNQQAPYIYFQF
jgi:alginate O-acetyltransferase complex protein AlgI